MKYDVLLKDVKPNEVVEIRLNDVTLVKCQRIPLSTIKSMDSVIGGMKSVLNITNSSLSFVATYGHQKLFTAVGDPSTYMKKGDGTFLSASLNKDKQIDSQLGFREVELVKDGAKVAMKIGKIIPYVAIAVTVIEVGTKIFLQQKEIKNQQVAHYKKIYEINEDSINNLWQSLEDYTYFNSDEAHRTANIIKINHALDEARNSLGKLYQDGLNSKRIDENLVYAMKKALEVYSFAHLLILMYSKVDDFSNYIENALKNINEKTLEYNEVLEKCYNQYIEDEKKHHETLKNTQFNNASKDKEDIAARVVLDTISGGVTEVISLGSKAISKKVTEKDQEAIKRLNECKNKNNPSLDCIENAEDIILLKKPVFKDDKYLYYQIDE